MAAPGLATGSAAEVASNCSSTQRVAQCLSLTAAIAKRLWQKDWERTLYSPSSGIGFIGDAFTMVARRPPLSLGGSRLFFATRQEARSSGDQIMRCWLKV